MNQPPDSAKIFEYAGYRVTIVKYPGKKWGAQWKGHDGQGVRIFRATNAELIRAIIGTMKLREDT